MALDRISSIQWNLDVPYEKVDFDGDKFYENTIGVTVLNDHHLREIHLKLDRHNAPYVLTKPLHHSQQVIENLEDGGVIISVKVHLNFEFDRLLLGFGDSIEVLKPEPLRNRLKKILNNAAGKYEKNITECP